MVYFDEDPNSREHFHWAWLFVFYEKLHGFHEYISLEFAHPFDGVVAYLRGLFLLVSEDSIFASMGLLTVGVKWFKTQRLKNKISWTFVDNIHPSLKWSEGMQRNVLKDEWESFFFFWFFSVAKVCHM